MLPISNSNSLLVLTAQIRRRWQVVAPPAAAFQQAYWHTDQPEKDSIVAADGGQRHRLIDPCQTLGTSALLSASRTLLANPILQSAAFQEAWEMHPQQTSIQEWESSQRLQAAQIPTRPFRLQEKVTTLPVHNVRRKRGNHD
jgi:hypothetical protein